MITNLISYIVSSIVDDKDSVNISSKKEKEFTVFTINVSPADKGKLVGKDGAVIKSIRALINSISSNKVRVVIGEN